VWAGQPWHAAASGFIDEENHMPLNDSSRRRDVPVLPGSIVPQSAAQQYAPVAFQGFSGPPPMPPHNFGSQ